jgi:asparagine synthase (glutamine-hydrolysing)
MGFVVPIESWFRGNLKSYLESVLLSEDTRVSQELIRPVAIQNLMTQHTATPTNLAPPLWSLLTLELWLRHYFP